MKLILLPVIIILTLSGCDLPVANIIAIKPSVYHDVLYYDSHPMERDQTNAWCGDNPGMAAKIPTCGNADQAGINAFNRKMGFLK